MFLQISLLTQFIFHNTSDFTASWHLSKSQDWPHSTVLFATNKILTIRQFPKIFYTTKSDTIANHKSYKTNSTNI